jgi:hypothetical protein
MATNSLPPAGVPSSGNQKYLAVAAVLLLLGGGLAIWKFKGGEDPKPPPVPTVIATQATTRDPRRDDDLPPPPDPVATTTASATKTAAPTGGGPASNGCDQKACRGSAGEDLVGALQLRGRQARHCYEKELANDPKLSVHMTVSVRVGTNGATCSANVANSDNPGIAACVANYYRNGGFPGAKGGCAEVNIPLKYVPNR